MPETRNRPLAQHLGRNTQAFARAIAPCTVAFAAYDEVAPKVRSAGTGVIVSLSSVTAVFTAGHVLRNLAKWIETRPAALFAPNGARLDIGPDMNAMWQGDDTGHDAGVIVLPRGRCSAFISGGQLAPLEPHVFVPTRMTPGDECLIAGFPAKYLTPRKAGDTANVGSLFQLYAGVVDRNTALHTWIGGTTDAEADESSFKPIRDGRDGDLKGMSGGGCWTNQGNDNAIVLRLRATHSSTDLDQSTTAPLRETPIEHHLRLLAQDASPVHDEARRLWPDISQGV